MNINFHALYYAAKFHRHIAVTFSTYKFKDVLEELEFDIRTRKDFDRKNDRTIVLRCGAQISLYRFRSGIPDNLPAYNLQGGQCE